ncbi:hypothetical protein [Nitrosomonas ureae]|nr:hypothetical protein [Nitrosomonas ureae]
MKIGIPQIRNAGFLSGVRPFMGSVGNAMAESFFATLECEMIDRRSWRAILQILGTNGFP